MATAKQPMTKAQIVSHFSNKFEITKKAVDYFSKENETLTIDGVRILFGDGWGLIRSSNTQPILVLRFEAKTESRLKEIQTQVVDKLKTFGEFKI